MSRIRMLSNRLSVLGYSGFEISHIINNAAGGKHLHALTHSQLHEVARQLEEYVALGTEYVASYSK